MAGPARRCYLDKCPTGVGEPEEQYSFSKKELAALRPRFVLEFEYPCPVRAFGRWGERVHGSSRPGTAQGLDNSDPVLGRNERRISA